MHRIQPLTILKDWRVLVASAVVVVNSTRCDSMLFICLLAVGMMFGAIYAHIGKKDTADLIGSGF